ncbi:MAG: GH36-type glycosyl hydrolase domain-containing protein [Candidatus Hodarchaeales archaeon]
MAKKSFGSGYFGEWIEDEYGLPAYRYTCDQINDPKAITPVIEGWRSETDHVHQVGNDRLVGVASNYGHVQVRQDEGSPKYLNDYDPDRLQFGGGIGYLTDGKNVISTYYPGQADSFNRVWGMGYFRKTVTGNGLITDQVIFAPFGDDPLLISQVTITNEREEPVDLRWIEYWGCKMHQFSFKSYMRSLSLRVAPSKLRRKFSERFSHKFSVINDDSGLLNTKKFRGLKFKDKLGWATLQLYLTFKGKALTGGRVKSPVKEAVLEDLSPPATFLVSLDSIVDGIATDGSQFFGEGGVYKPDGLQKPLSSKLDSSASGNAMFLERKLHLKPGEKKTLYFAYGYLPKGFDLDSLLDKYRKNLPDQLSCSCEAWENIRLGFTIPKEPWVDREIHWSYYYLRSNLTYDSFFKEHILSQGQYYQYCVGFQGAARDPLQHALPLIYGDEVIRNYVKEVLRYTLKEVQPNGQIPYGIVGSGHLMPSPFIPSDQEMWLLWLASEYVLASRDLAFLEEEIPTYPIYGSKAGKSRIKDLLYRCYQHFVIKTGTGKHGLQRISNGDWNDLAVHGYVPNEKHEEVIEYGESVLNAAMASFVLDIYSKLLTYAGEKELADDAQQRSEAQRNAVQEQWCGKWFRRAWLTEDLGWVGEDQMWLEPQPWAIIGSATNPEQKKILVKSIDEGLRQPSKIGAMLHPHGLKKKEGETLGIDSPNGIGTSGGIWPSINGTLIWALSLVDGAMAWDEWKKNTFATHAEAYPDVWYGIWSGPDTYNSALSDYPGQTVFKRAMASEGSDAVSLVLINVAVTDFPVMCMHPHAWPLANIGHLLGIKFTVEGVELAPTIPEDEYTFNTPLLGFEKSKQGYSGWYAPGVTGTWKHTLKLGKDESMHIKELLVNGKEKEIHHSDGCIIWSGESSSDKPLIWEIKK